METLRRPLEPGHTCWWPGHMVWRWSVVDLNLGSVLTVVLKESCRMKCGQKQILG